MEEKHPEDEKETIDHIEQLVQQLNLRLNLPLRDFDLTLEQLTIQLHEALAEELYWAAIQEL